MTEAWFPPVAGRYRPETCVSHNRLKGNGHRRGYQPQGRRVASQENGFRTQPAAACAAFAVRASASGRSRGLGATRKPRRYRETIIHWSPAALESPVGCSKLPRSPECGNGIPATSELAKNSFLLHLWLSPQQHVGHQWASPDHFPLYPALINANQL